jgi:hypothetical protein
MDSGLFLPHLPNLSKDYYERFTHLAVGEPHPDSNTRIVAMSEKDIAFLLSLIPDTLYHATYDFALARVGEMRGEFTWIPDEPAAQTSLYALAGNPLFWQREDGGVKQGWFGTYTDNLRWYPWYGGGSASNPFPRSLVFSHNGNFSSPSGVTYDLNTVNGTTLHLTTLHAHANTNFRVRLINRDTGGVVGTWTFNQSQLLSNPTIYSPANGNLRWELMNNQGGSSALWSSWRIALSRVEVVCEPDTLFEVMIPDKRAGGWVEGETIGDGVVGGVKIPVVGSKHEEIIKTLWVNRLDELRQRLMVDLTDLLTQLNSHLALIEEHNERLADASERIALALEAQQTGEGLEDIAGAIGALAPLLAG